MAWDDIREYAERPVRVRFEGRVQLDLPSAFLQTDAGKRLAIEIIESEAAAFGSQLARAMSTARSTLSARIDVVPPDRQMLPWLLGGHGRSEPIAVRHAVHDLLHRVRLDVPLHGQKLEDLELANILVGADRRYAMRPVTIVVDEIEFVEGSLSAKFKGFIVAASAAITLLLAAAGGTTYITDKYENAVIERRIDQMVEGQRCSIHSKWNIDLDSLRSLTLEALDYDDSGISKAESQLRICNVQLMLLSVQGTPTMIDGIAGQKTRDALKFFAAKYNLSADIHNEQLRGQLLTDFKATLKK